MNALAERRLILASESNEDEIAAHQQSRPEELRLLEALLFAASEPLDEAVLKARLPEGVDIRAALRNLQADYAARGVNLVRVAGKWTFRTANDLAWLLAKDVAEPKKLSRAALENSLMAISWIAAMIGELFALAEETLFLTASAAGLRKSAIQRSRAIRGLSVHSLKPAPSPGLHFANSERLRTPAISRTRMSSL